MKNKTKGGKKKGVLKRRSSSRKTSAMSDGKEKQRHRKDGEENAHSKANRARYAKIWNQRLEELKEYKEKHGNCNVPRGYSANKPLGEWVRTQRKQYRLKQEGRKSTMTKARIDQLNAIGFVWTPRQGWKRVKSTTRHVKIQKNDSNKRANNTTTTSNKKRKRQQIPQNPPSPPRSKEAPASPPSMEESEKIKRRRIAKEWLKNWRDKPGSSIRDLL